MTTGNPNVGPDQATNMPLNSDAYPSISGAGTDPTDTSSGQSTGDAVKQKAGQVADQAQQAVSQATDKAQQQAKSQIATRKEQAASSLTDVSHAVGQVGDQLRQNDHDTLAQYADMAAQQVSRASSYLREHNVNELLDDVQNFARRQPAIFLAGAMALGLLGARFLKSSSPQSSSRSSYRMPNYLQGGTGRYYGRGTYNQSTVYDPNARRADVRELPR